MSTRWGILGTGRIATEMAEAIALVPEADLHAVASRSQAGADAFAARWSVPRAYAGYETLMGDPDVDIVYVATPNGLHRDNVMTALDAGKHVLCEKPFATSSADTVACAERAREKGRFLMEAMWTACMPAMQRAAALVREGAIGTVRHLSASFVARRDADEYPHLFDPALGGGATLDLGVYSLTVARLLGGPILDSSAQVVWGTSGVDEMVVASVRHEHDVVSELAWGFRVDLPRGATVVGDEGSLRVSPLPNPSRIELARGDHTEVIDLPPLGRGLAHEVMHVEECLRDGLLESPLHPMGAAVRTAEVIEGIIAAT